MSGIKKHRILQISKHGNIGMIIVKNKNFQNYEQDIRELLQAFFPGSEIRSEEAQEALLRAEEAAEESIEIDVDALLKGKEIPQERLHRKSTIKKELYEHINRLTGKKLPWGTLTGIKPVKLADMILNEGVGEAEADRRIREHYLVSGPKRELMLKIALRERKLCSVLPEHGYSVYIGIPFCPSRCLYCSFTSNPVDAFKGRVEEYLDDLGEELFSFQQQNAQWMGQEKLHPSTLYIGGGTPTALNEKQLEKLLAIVEDAVDVPSLLEYTVESGRPDSITEEKLGLLRQYGVGRISVNPQTMNQKTLDLIGRRHSVQQTLDAFAMARSAGFDNINMDVIMGLPEETTEDVAHTLSVIEDLRPDSLTVHSLSVKRAARLSVEHDPWLDYRRAEGVEAARMTAMGAETAARLGMVPYYLYRQKNIAGNQENIGYALPGKESLYNIIMMEEKQPVIGFGAGSTTKVGTGSNERMENIKNLELYLERIDEVIEKKETFLSKQLFF